MAHNYWTSTHASIYCVYTPLFRFINYKTSTVLQLHDSYGQPSIPKCFIRQTFPSQSCITHTLAWSRKNRLVYNLHNKTIPNQSFGKCESSRTKSYHVCWRTALYRWTECSHHLIFNLELAGRYHNQLSYHALSTFRVCSHAWKSSNVTRPTQGRKYVKLHTRVVNRTTIWRIWWRERKRKQAYKRR